MRIRQYVYLGLVSRQVSAAEVTARLGVEPDRVRVRGARSTRPPIPVFHAWEVVCDEPRLRVDEQLARVVHRLTPHHAEIVALARELRSADPQHGGAVMRVVRYLAAEDGAEEELSSPDARLQKLPGQHHLLSWTVDREVLEFLSAVEATLDVDEYG
ncbi:DUF4279 domain-containing protein [Actinokineospora alba]|uniref:DUF4279 domain-containing protein n=1 Tax=Actinokineospora alba TaxID=504798 RepID=UPI000B84AF6E|nr:DUF4279 domain-containing protein [Actinokineospora alba]